MNTFQLILLVCAGAPSQPMQKGDVQSFSFRETHRMTSDCFFRVKDCMAGKSVKFFKSPEEKIAACIGHVDKAIVYEDAPAKEKK